MTFHGTVYIWAGEPIPAVPWVGNGFTWSELVAEMAREEVRADGGSSMSEEPKVPELWWTSRDGCICRTNTGYYSINNEEEIDLPANAVRLVAAPQTVSETSRPRRCSARVPEGNVITEGRQCQQYEGHPHDHTWYGDNGTAYSAWRTP